MIYIALVQRPSTYHGSLTGNLITHHGLVKYQIITQCPDPHHAAKLVLITHYAANPFGRSRVTEHPFTSLIPDKFWDHRIAPIETLLLDEDWVFLMLLGAQTGRHFCGPID